MSKELKVKIKEIEKLINGQEKLSKNTIRKKLIVEFKNCEHLILDNDFETDMGYANPLELKIFDLKKSNGKITGKVDYGCIDEFGNVIMDFLFMIDSDDYLHDWSRTDGKRIPYSGHIENALMLLNEHKMINK
jgi:hypothetical protein